MQNRPFHVRDGKIEELDKTATNILVATLFLEPAVVEYELLYFREIDKVPGSARRSGRWGSSGARRSWPTWWTSSTASTSRS